MKFLLEDKVVKFNGETYPEFGWCVIMCGGPGSGKSTILKTLVPIQAKKFDVDDIKQYAVKRGEIADNELIFNGKHYSLDGINEPYDLSNGDYVSFLHKNLKPLNNKIKSNVYDNVAGNANKDRLPNLAFDIAGSDIDDFENIFVQLAPLGYKFCVVWAFTPLERALWNNSHRDRNGNRPLVIKKYGDVLATISQFMRRRDLIRYVNDFWVVLAVDYTLHGNEYKFVKENNVRKVDISSGIANLTDELADMVDEQQRVYDKLASEEPVHESLENTKYKLIKYNRTYDENGLDINENEEVFINGSLEDCIDKELSIIDNIKKEARNNDEINYHIPIDLENEPVIVNKDNKKDYYQIVVDN